MERIEIYRTWFEQEKDSNRKMFAMIESVPDSNRSQSSFERILVLAGHLAACRENWLDRMTNGARSQKDWWPEPEDLQSLVRRYEATEAAWTAYLSSLNDEALDQDFEYPYGRDKRFRWNVEGQIRQLVGHAFYHRGQIALLVEQLGGEAVDTDYLYWAFERQPERWRELTD